MNKRKLLKLIIKILIIFTLCFWALTLALHFTLSYIASRPSTKEKIVLTVKKQMNTDISIGSISAGIFDLKIKDVSLSVEDKNIANIDLVYLHFSLKHLITGQLRITNIIMDGLNLKLTRNIDGKFNIEPILKAPAFAEDKNKKEKKKKVNEEEDTDVFDVLIKKINVNHCNIFYTDEKENISTSVNKLNFVITDFSLEKPFDLFIYFNIVFQNKYFNIRDLHLSLSSTINLNSLKLAEANIEIKNFIIRLKNSIIKTTGTITNLKDPKADLNTKIFDLSSDSLADIVELPKFLIPEIDIETKLNTNLNESLVEIEKIAVNVLDCDIVADGKINYAENLKYNIDIAIKFILDKITQVAEITKPYKITGTIQSKLNITDESSIISGNISIMNIATFLPQFGNITEINSDIAIKNINNINIPSFTGKINSYPFVSSASYLANDKKGKLKINFFADKIYGKISKEYEEQKKKLQEEKSKQQNIQAIANNVNKEKIAKESNEQNIKQKIQKPKTQKSSIKPIDIDVYYKANYIDAPYLMGNNIKFTLNMKGVTPALDNIEGNINLSTSDGTIKDIYKLTDANVLLKGTFLSLKIISNVVNALNVLDILNSIGNVVSSKDKQDKSASSAENTETTQEKLDGKIDFLSFITSMTFKEGNGVFKNCSFVSNLMSFKVAGNINFKENIVDMTVNAAPGKHEEEGGSMPLKMNITGTTDQPNGSLSLLGSVSSLVGDALTKNFVSGSLRSGFSRLIGLKKHDENGNDIPEEPIK